MYEIKKILVTGDFLRQRQNQAGTSSQKGNIKWIYHMIKPALSMLSNHPISPIVFTGNNTCVGSKIFALNKLPVTFESWVGLYYKDPSPQELAVIQDTFQDALVISFEMPELVKKAFDVLDIPYIDVTIHPARFMDDLLFGLRSNIAGVSDKLVPWIVYEEEIQISAGMALATLQRLPRIKTCEDTENIALFAGQTTDDRVLIHNGQLINVDDFMERFSELSSLHEKILVKPHPMAKENPFMLALTRLFPNTEIIDGNFYHIMSHENITHVYSLTSSTSIEAAYMGKIGVHLTKYPFCFSDKTAYGGAYLTIKPHFYLPSFWEKILSCVGHTSLPVRNINIPESRSRIRMSMRSYWGADIFENII